MSATWGGRFCSVSGPGFPPLAAAINPFKPCGGVRLQMPVQEGDGFVPGVLRVVLPVHFLICEILEGMPGVVIAVEFKVLAVRRRGHVQFVHILW